VHDSVAVCGDVPNVTLTGRVHVKPGDADATRLTVPVRPFNAVTVMVEEPEAPASIWAGLTVLADIAKSTTWNSTVPVVWLRVPSVPVTVTV
jgi:hypothetical protein